jgi:hypothetical protein
MGSRSKKKYECQVGFQQALIHTMQNFRKIYQIIFGLLENMFLSHGRTRKNTDEQG